MKLTESPERISIENRAAHEQDHHRSVLYSGATVRDLFSEMAATYGVVNLVSSFGFSRRWRRQCVERARIDRGDVVCDLMTGMGECLSFLVRQKSALPSSIRGIDFCPEMCARANETAARLEGATAVDIAEENVLSSTLEDSSIDRIVCAFGLKTLSDRDLARLATEVARVLKPGGRFSFVEISEPHFRPLRWLYALYLRGIIPWIGRLFLGNPDNYRQLGVYTRRFGDCTRAQKAFADAGLEVSCYSLFFGCATGISGRKLSAVPAPT